MRELKNYMRDKFIEGYEGYEIVITLLALVKEGRLKEGDILPVMDYVFAGNDTGVYNALIKAKELVDDSMVDSILRRLKSE